ncbi:MAG: glycosyltransferase family 39 protein, partial [Burkholderiales bacterium]|nr:glycosyltransferase family 39 protein [Burkholderiales bacterium]
VLGSNDSNFYAVVAKHIVDSNNWINLTFDNKDWLDKPHFPFWLIAISYKIFGISVFAYILPGFIFNVIGGFYTYLLAKHIFASREVGLLSALIYFTSLHLMLSSIDIRQEAFLLGEIIPACYYWYLYNEQPNINKKYLILGGVFTALAMMTKGIFVLLTIFSGLVVVWIVTKNWRNFVSKKWLFALLISFVFIAPELITLYLQFDAHPEKIVFGKQNISGILWFFWGSQFGRFFDTGAITSGKASSIGHYFYFIHTMFWAILPWSFVVFFAFVNILKSIKISKNVLQSLRTQKARLNYIYLLASFIPTFVLFSLTKFQLDHYTNILIPFLAILCADFLFNTTTKLAYHPIFKIQVGLSYLLCAIVIVLSLIIFTGQLFIAFLVCSMVVVGLFAVLINNYPLTKAILFSVLSMLLVFVFLEAVNAKLYSQYEVGYQINKYLSGTNNNYELIDYKVNSLSLELFAKSGYKRVDCSKKIESVNKPYYLVVNDKQTSIASLESSNIILLLNRFKYIKQEKFIPTLFNEHKQESAMNIVSLYLIK